MGGRGGRGGGDRGRVLARGKRQEAARPHAGAIFSEGGGASPGDGAGAEQERERKARPEEREGPMREGLFPPPPPPPFKETQNCKTAKAPNLGLDLGPGPREGMMPRPTKKKRQWTACRGRNITPGGRCEEDPLPPFPLTSVYLFISSRLPLSLRRTGETENGPHSSLTLSRARARYSTGSTGEAATVLATQTVSASPTVSLR